MATLITEMVEEVKYLVEEVTPGQKSYYISGIFMQANKQNRNGRVYPKALLQREAARYTVNYINPNRAFSELGHPDTPTINLDRVSHMIKELREQGDDFWGKAKILDTPYGKMVKNFIDEGAKLGVSTRGLGTLKEQNGVKMVQDDFHLTAIDIVSDPSASDAWVQGLMENKEWIRSHGGTWVEAEYNNAKKALNDANRKDYEEVKARAFADFLKHL